MKERKPTANPNLTRPPRTSAHSGERHSRHRDEHADPRRDDPNEVSPEAIEIDCKYFIFHDQKGKVEPARRSVQSRLRPEVSSAAKCAAHAARCRFVGRLA